MRNESDFDLYQLPMHLQDLIEDELDQSETIIWMDQPDPKKIMLTAIPIILFAIPWTAFSVFWMAGASGFEMPDFDKPESFFMLFGLPFLLIGFGMLSSPFWIARKAKKTVYILTDKQAIIFDGGWSTTIRSYRPNQLGKITRKQQKDGSGDLIFETKVSYNNEGDQKRADLGFIAIRNVKMVKELIDDLVNRSQNVSGS